MTTDALQVRVLRLTGEPVELAVASEATVHELKLLLNETCDVPYFCQKVMLGHSLLQSTDALSSLPFPISLTLVVDSFHPEVAPVLQEAARHGDLRAVEQALSAPADPNQEGQSFTRLHCISREADEHGWTPLILAAHAGHGEVLRLLHRASANLETTTPHRRTPFFVACQRGHVEAARVLCELGANKEKARTGGYTPLLIACREGHAPVVKLLCEMRADKEHAAMHGWTPLLLAARHGHNAVTKVLQQAGVDTCRSLPDGTTTIHFAAEHGNQELASFLVEIRANLDQARGDGATALHLAADFGHVELVSTLLEARADPLLATDDTMLALHLAARSGHAKISESLHLFGSPLNASTMDGLTPLHFAACNGHIEAAPWPESNEWLPPLRLLPLTVEEFGRHRRLEDESGATTGRQKYYSCPVYRHRRRAERPLLELEVPSSEDAARWERAGVAMLCELPAGF